MKVRGTYGRERFRSTPFSKKNYFIKISDIFIKRFIGNRKEFRALRSSLENFNKTILLIAFNSNFVPKPYSTIIGTN